MCHKVSEPCPTLKHRHVCQWSVGPVFLAENLEVQGSAQMLNKKLKQKDGRCEYEWKSIFCLSLYF